MASIAIRNFPALLCSAFAAFLCAVTVAASHADSDPTGQGDFLPPSTNLPVAPPAGAIVLFDGSENHQLLSMNGGPVDWPLEDGALVSTHHSGKANHLVSKLHFRDADIHVEFMLPRKGVGNSGLYIHGHYEMQIHKPPASEELTDQDVGALYGFSKPLTNAGCEPGEWQSYDIRYRAPRRDDARKITKEGHVTAYLNGKLVQDDARFGEPRSVYHPFRFFTTPYLKQIAKQQKATQTGPLFLQDHDAPVRFRSVWVRPLDDRAFMYAPQSATE